MKVFENLYVNPSCRGRVIFFALVFPGKIRINTRSTYDFPKCEAENHTRHLVTVIYQFNQIRNGLKSAYKFSYITWLEYHSLLKQNKHTWMWPLLLSVHYFSFLCFIPSNFCIQPFDINARQSGSATILPGGKPAI